MHRSHPSMHLLTLRGEKGGRTSSCAERGKAPTATNKGREMRTVQRRRERGGGGGRGVRNIKKGLIGAERRERRLHEPWEVLPNCQIATSCELFSV